jgi:hypothetical protein
MEGTAGRSARAEYERRHSARKARLRARFGRLAPAAGLIAGEPASERRWRVGAEAEIRTAERLSNHLRRKGVAVLNDRRIPGTRANIDHLVVGPAGVTVIDTKNYTGEVRVRRGKLWVKGRNRTKLVDGVLWQVELVREVLERHGLVDAPVTACLAWSNVDALPLLRSLELNGVLIDGTRKVARHAARSGALTVAQVDQTAALLADAFAPA